MAADDTDVQGRLLALEAKNARIWNHFNLFLHDQDDLEKRIKAMEKRLAVIEAWLDAGDEEPKAEGSDEE